MINNSINAVGGLPIAVDNGGTGLASLTNHGILVGQGTNDVLPIVLTNGQLLIGSTGADPVAATLTAGFGVSITNGAGSISIAATGANPWVVVTGTSQTMSVNTSYIANNAALVTLTLPATAAVGDRFIIVAKGAGLFKIAQNSGQSIRFGEVVSTTGISGFMQATLQYDVVEIVCMTADTDFIVVDAVGNLDLQ